MNLLRQIGRTTALNLVLLVWFSAWYLVGRCLSLWLAYHGYMPLYFR